MSPRHTRPRPVPLQLESLEDRCVPTAFDNQAFVATLYQALLGRPADPGGLAFWSNQLAQGSTWQQVAGSFVTGTEYRGRQVEDLYETLLGHPADSAGLGYWFYSLQGGASLEQVKAGFLGSDEFFLRAGGTAVGFLNALYQDVLGRAVDPLGAQAFLAAAGGGAAARTAVALEVVQSTEADRIEAANDYTEVLGRAPDDTGLAVWTGLLHGGAGDESVLAGIVGSSEFFLQLQQTVAGSHPPDAVTAAGWFVAATHRLQVADTPQAVDRLQSPAFGAFSVPPLPPPPPPPAPTETDIVADINPNITFLTPGFFVTGNAALPSEGLGRGLTLNPQLPPVVLPAA